MAAKLERTADAQASSRVTKGDAPSPEPKERAAKVASSPSPPSAPASANSMPKQKGAPHTPPRATTSAPTSAVATPVANGTPIVADADANVDDGWLMSCDAKARPQQVVSSLRRYLNGVPLQDLELGPSAFASTDAFKARVSELLHSKRISFRAASGAAWWKELRSALEELCCLNVLLLLRPAAWDEQASSLTARFVYELNEAFVDILSEEGEERMRRWRL